MGFNPLDIITKPLSAIGSIPGSILGGVGSGISGSSGAQNGFQANAYGINPAQTTLQAGSGPFGLPTFTTTPSGPSQGMTSAFTYNDPASQTYANTAAGGVQGINQAQTNQQGVASNQNALTQMLMSQAGGTGPSMADLQFGKALGASRNQADSIAANAIANGVSPAVAYQMAGQQAGQNGQAASADSAMAKIQEVLAARQQLGTQLGTQSNQNLSQEQISLQQLLQSLGLSQNSSQFGSTSQQALQSLLSQNYNTAQGLNASVASGNSALSANMLGALLGAGGAAGAAALGK